MRRQREQRRGAIVAMHLVTDGTISEASPRFTMDTIAEARCLLARYPAVADNRRNVIRSASPLCIQHRSVFPDQAAALAQDFLALYRRMLPWQGH